MVSFWADDDGEEITVDIKKVDTGAAKPALFPDDTNLLVRIDEARWTEYEGVKYIRVKTIVMSPPQYEGRIVSKSLYVTDPDNRTKPAEVAKKKKKARTDLMKMDALHKGKLRANGDGIPTDEQLQLGLIGSQQVWTMGQFTPPGASEPIQFVKAMNAKGMVEVAKAEVKRATPAHSGFSDELDDGDLPF